MAFGSAGYTPTFSGDLTASAGKKLWKELSKRYKKRRIAKKLEERKKAKTPQQKKEVEERAKEEEKQDQQEIQEVKVEEVKEEKKQVAATQKLLSSAKNPASAAVNNDVVPVTVKDVTGKPTTQLLPAAKKSGARRGGGFTPLPGGSPSLLPPAQDNIKQTTAIVKRNNDALVTAIKGEVNDVRSAIIDVSFETVETRNMMGVLINEEKKQTAAFKKQADILEDSTKFKKRKYQQQLIFFKQQRSKEKKDRTGAAGLVTGAGGGGGGLPSLGFPNPLSLLPFLRNFRPGRNRRNRNRNRNRNNRNRNRGGGPGGGRRRGNGFFSRRQRFRNNPALRQRYDRYRQFRRNRRLGPILNLLRRGRGGVRGLSNLALIGGAYGLDAVIDMAQRRSMTPGRGVTTRSQLGPQMQQRIDDAAAARRASEAATPPPQPTRSLTRGSGSSSLSQVEDPYAKVRKELAQEIKDKGLKSKGRMVNGKYVSVDASEVKDILNPKVPFMKKLQKFFISGPMDMAEKLPFIGDKIKWVRKKFADLRKGLKNLTLPKAITFIQDTIKGITGKIPENFGLKKAFKTLTAPVRGALKILKGVAKGGKGIVGLLGKALKGGGRVLGRVLGPLMELGFFVMDAKSRMDMGKSPAAAMLPLIPRIALTAGGAALLGAIGGPLAPLTAIAGGFLGGLLGDKVVDFIDSQWSPDVDKMGIMQDFNNFAYDQFAKIGYTPPKSEQEAINLQIEKEAAELGVNPQEYSEYTGTQGLPATSAEATRETPDMPTTGGSAAQRLLRSTGMPNPLDAASKFIFSKFRPSHRPGHNGLDIAGGPWKSGADLSVVNPGKVIDVGDLSKGTGDPTGWGNFVVVSHADGTQSLYGHLDSIAVRKGDDVARGTIIGKLGNTGASQGPHLHFELGSGWNGGVLRSHMDPANHIDKYVAVGGGAMDGTEFRPREGTAAQTTAAVLNNSVTTAGAGMQTIAVQLPPNIYPMQDGNADSPGGPTLERVNNELLYLQNVEQRILVG